MNRNQIKRLAKSSASIFLALCIASLSPGILVEVAQAADTTCSVEPHQYTLKPTGKNRFSVELSIKTDVEILGIASRRDQSRSIRTDDFIENVRQVLKNGSEKALAHNGEGNWSIEDTTPPLVVRYDIQAGHDRYQWRNGKEEIAYTFDDAFFFTGWSALLGDYANVECPALVAFDLPDGWEVAAPWEKIQKNLFRANSVLDLQKNGFALGPDLATFTADAGGSNLTIIYEKVVEDIAKTAARDADAIFRFYERVYGSGAGKDYHIFMVSDEGSDGGAFESSFAQRFSLPSHVADERGWRHVFAHEIGHLWNGIALRPETPSELEWFKEGFTDYLTAKGMYQLGIIDQRQLEDKIASIIRRYYLSLSTKGPQSLIEAGANKQDNRMLIYGGGATVALLLDAALDQTIGKGAFEASLARVFSHKGTPYSLGQLMNLLDDDSRGMASQILSDVNQGIFPGDMKSRLSRYGIALGFLAPEEIYISFIACEENDERCIPRFLVN